MALQAPGQRPDDSMLAERDGAIVPATTGGSTMKMIKLGALLLAMLASSALAQTWPDKPVRLVLSQPPGSGPDNVARILSDSLGRKLGKSVVVDNKPGGQNMIGAQNAARSPADGYTFYLATTAALVTNVYLFKSLSYDPQKDFAPVGFIGKSPFAVLVEASSPIKSIQDFLARARSEPGKLSVANEGPKTFSGMIARLLNARAKLELNLVPYVSVGAAVQDTLGGRVDVLVADVASTAQFVSQGRLRMLAVTSPKRIEGWEQVPALNELVPGFDMVGWMAVVAPVGTPQPIIQRMNQSLDAALIDKEVAAKIHSVGPMSEGAGTPEQLGAFLAAEHQRWEQISKEIGVLPE
jgi:tripartite-type tricarboxylate transporter receptor subunit TctC